MADSKALPSGELKWAVPSGLITQEIPASYPLRGDTTIFKKLDSVLAPSTHGDGFRPGDPLQGVIASIGDDIIYHRVWVAPLDVDGSFITEESENNIYIWNAAYDETVTIESVSSVLPDGTSFSLQDSDCPIELGVDAEVIYVVTIEKPGPPIQDTYYTVTIEGVTYEIYVHGIRVIPVDQEPDWTSPAKYRYRFQTTIANSPTYQEQRRSLTDRMVRDAVIQFTIQNNLLSRFINDITYGHDKVFGVPIYSETSVLSTQAASGALTLYLNDETDYNWNINNIATHVIIMDWENDVKEIKEVDTINSTNIVLSRQLINTYAAGSVVMPCFFGTLKAIRQVSHTDNTQTIDIEFSEFLLGSSS